VRSLRVRLAALVGVVSLVVLALAGWAAVEVVSDRMRDSVRDQALRALDQARVGWSGDLPPGAATAGELGTEVRVLERRSPLPGPPPDDDLLLVSEDVPEIPDGETVVLRREVDGDPAYVAMAALTDDEGNRVRLIAAAPLGAAEGTIASMRRAALVAVPTLTLVLAGLAALVAGRTLRPVSVMRAEADVISHGTLHHRLTPTTRAAELAALAATMNDMLDRLERSATSQRQLVSDVSHELRSPLATIRASIELGDGRGLAVALAEVDRLEDMVSDLLTLSRLDEAGPARTEDLDLEDVVAAQAAAVGRSGVRIDTSAVAPARLHADRRAVVGLVRNLLDNAARHAASTVRVAVTSSGDHVELIVDDDGPGIPEDQRSRVFERFTRLDEGRSRDAGGAGLGLAVAAAAAHAQGGTVTVGDAPDGGARLHVRLPARPARG
jgi:signal transduction histidine kinase